MQRTPGVVAVHHQIADALRARIESGALPPGAELPSVKELTETWKCAPATARAGLSVLQDEGRITTSRGRAARVREPRRPVTHVDLSDRWTQRQKELVLTPRAERADTGAIELTAGVPIADTDSTYHYEIVSADPDAASVLGIPVGTKIQVRQYEMRDKRDGTRLSWSVSRIPLALIESNSALLDESNEPWPGGHQHQLYTVGIEIDRFERLLTAVEPTPYDRTAWKMESGVPLIRIRSKSIDINDRVVEFSDATYPADRTEVTYIEKLDRWPVDHPHFDPENGDA